jgi:hypothetical protein
MKSSASSPRRTKFQSSPSPTRKRPKRRKGRVGEGDWERRRLECELCTCSSSINNVSHSPPLPLSPSLSSSACPGSMLATMTPT